MNTRATLRLAALDKTFIGLGGSVENDDVDRFPCHHNKQIIIATVQEPASMQSDSLVLTAKE